MRSNLKKRGFYLIFMITIIVTYWGLSKIVNSVDGWFFRPSPPTLFKVLDLKIKDLGSKDELSPKDYDHIFRYLIEGISAYKTEEGSQIIYPGVPGTRGLVVEGLEGFARTAPMIATWLSSGRSRNVKLSDGSTYDILSHLKNGIIQGTTPSSSGYWGDFEDFDQRAVEAADIALVIWLLKKKMNVEFNSLEFKHIKNWLKQINKKQIHGGNWHLFRLIVNTVLFDFGDDSKKQAINQDYNEFKSFYVGDGWFSDGKNGAIDYYNVWQMQYFLFWLSEIKPNLDDQFIHQVFTLFAKSYKYFISKQGFPIWGRSSCYRLAAPVPLIINGLKNNQEAALAKRSLDATWIYFIGKGSLKSGTVTQGYCGNDPELLENYSGRASCLWSLRSLTLAYYQKESGSIWKATGGLLPIETGDYEINIKGPKLKVIGNTLTHEVTVEQLEPYKRITDISDQPLIEMPLWRSFAEVVLRRPLRLDNFEVKYGRKKYTNITPFCKCVIVN
jgi:hypothetical protein